MPEMQYAETMKATAIELDERKREVIEVVGWRQPQNHRTINNED